MITTNRYLFLGAHVTSEVKAALRSEAMKRDVSVSWLVFTILCDVLEQLGYKTGKEAA